MYVNREEELLLVHTFAGNSFLAAGSHNAGQDLLQLALS